MKKVFIVSLIMSCFLCGCASNNGYPNTVVPIGVTVIKPMNTVCNVDDLYGNYNVDFDLDSLTDDSITVKFFTKEVYDYNDCKDLKAGQAMEYNNGSNHFIIQTLDDITKPIEGTDLTYNCTLINGQFELMEGSNFYYLSYKENGDEFWHSSGEEKKLYFADDFVFYPDNSYDTAIYDAKTAVEYMKQHPGFDHTNTNIAVDKDKILAIIHYKTSDTQK